MLETDRVVLLRHDVDGGTQAGSGLRVGGEHVLTADHCVTGRNVRVVHGGREFPAQVVVRSFSSDVDLAVLLVPGLGSMPPLGFARVNRGIAGAIDGCQALGFPRWKRSPKSRILVQLDGRIPTAEGLVVSTQEAQPVGLLSLKLPGHDIPLPPPPQGSLYASGSPWGGMSGAAVVSEGLVIGVLRSHNISEGTGSLTVTPIDAIDILAPATRGLMWSTLGVSDPGSLSLLPRSDESGAKVEEQGGSGEPGNRTGTEKEASRAQVIKRVTKNWVESGPSIAVLQGFSGSGKTRVALDIKSLHPRRKVLDVEIPEGISSLEQLIILIGDAFAAAGKPGVTLGTNPKKNLADAMSDGTILILDNFHHCFVDDSGAPSADVQGLINSVGRQIRATHGRLLLIANEAVTFPWIEDGETFTLPGMSVSEGSRLLSKELTRQGIPENDVPADRISEVINWLGGNPRAITLLAACLRSESLEDLIGAAPAPWELRDRSVGRDFSAQLERAFLERCIGRLTETERKLLNRASVHRVSFTNEAFRQSFWEHSPQEFDAAKKRLTSSFLVERRNKNFAVNPIAREISLRALAGSGSELRRAHTVVGRFHARHFKAKRIVSSGADFLEARYHLYAAGEADELSVVAKSYVLHLDRLYGYKRTLEKDPKERDELIALLSAALSEVSPSWRLHFYLARLLEARGVGGDHAHALEQVDHAVRSPNASLSTWMLKARLTDRLHGTEAALAVATEAHKKLAESNQNVGQILFFRADLLARDNRRLEEAASLCKEALSTAENARLPHLYMVAAEFLAKNDEGLAAAIDLLREGVARLLPGTRVISLYPLAAAYLNRAGKLTEAIDLLSEGISHFSSHSSVTPLYDMNADLLARNGRVDEAVDLLREGIARIPPQSSLFSLYQSAGELLARNGQMDEAVDLLREGITRIPPRSNLSPLYQSAGELLARNGRVDEAVDLLREGIARIPPQSNLSSLYQSAGNVLARNGQVDEAVDLLREGITRIPPQSSLFSLYQSAGNVLARNGQVDEAVDLLREGITRIPPQSSLFSLYQSAGELLARNGQTDEAVDLLREGITRIPP
ncbi:tetratricopeptide repeat protein, partial [Streptomyces sp. NPDC017936]|uniref:tetratricopeptide repeat protein n=1 Tax=Streptomyces sp. NPDC017936 TaxID=3365016 RepID=UPI0037B86344